MCGISGIWGEIANGTNAPHLLNMIMTSLQHRGPDGTNCWIGNGVGLAHNRLAIIDLNTGQQPMWDAAHEQVIVFNGEIYNYLELRAELETKGFIFKTNSDTEVIPAVIKAWGIDEGLRKLRGMFAFALYNTKTLRLLLARDRVGIKPMYWTNVPNGFIFASEIKALLSSDIVSKNWNPTAIQDYLAYGYAITPQTCWRDIFMLPPGSWMEISPGGQRQGYFWQWEIYEDDTISQQQVNDLVEQVLVDSLKCHLIADVPIGAFLSGGLDSSLIAALLRYRLDKEVEVFNIGFGDSAYDESVQARSVANHLNLEFHSIQLGKGTANSSLFTKILQQYDEPFGDSSCIPTYMICHEIRQYAKVALSGDGGDEVLGGYPRYKLANRLASLSHFHVFKPLFDPMSQVIAMISDKGRQFSKAWQFSQMPRNVMLSALHEYFNVYDRTVLYSDGFADKVRSSESVMERFSKFVPSNPDQPAQQLLSTEMHLRLHANYLRKVDIASSAHGLEVRVPYLDNEMLSLAEKIPYKRKVGADGTLKIISRELAKKYLPPEISVKKKQGFTIPLDTWIGQDTHNLLQDLLISPTSRINTILKPSAVKSVWDDFSLPSNSHRLSRYQRYQRVFLLASLELWLRTSKPILS